MSPRVPHLRAVSHGGLLQVPQASTSHLVHRGEMMLQGQQPPCPWVLGALASPPQAVAGGGGRAVSQQRAHHPHTCHLHLLSRCLPTFTGTPATVWPGSCYLLPVPPRPHLPLRQPPTWPPCFPHCPRARCRLCFPGLRRQPCPGPWLPGSWEGLLQHGTGLPTQPLMPWVWGWGPAVCISDKLAVAAGMAGSGSARREVLAGMD